MQIKIFVMEESNVAVRLKRFVETTGLTYSQFADRCGIPRPSFSQLLNGRNKKLSDIVVKQIHDTFPSLSVLWLMFGEGQMLLQVEDEHLSAAEFEDSPAYGSANFDFANLSDLNSSKSAPIDSGFQSVKSVFDSANSNMQIVQNPVSARRVVSITVFYDDNSYETFHPDKK